MYISNARLNVFYRAGAARLQPAEPAQRDLPGSSRRRQHVKYAGSDRFGRVKGQYWDGYGSTADVDRFQYGYNAASGRTDRDIDLSSYSADLKDQVYSSSRDGYLCDQCTAAKCPDLDR